MRQLLRELAERLRGGESGQAMVEYALLLGLVAVVAIGALSAMGQSVQGVLTALEASVSSVPGA